MKTTSTRIAMQFAICLVIGLIFGWIVSEGSFQTLKTGVDRPPQTTQIIIPEGTADKLAAHQPIPSLPDNLQLAEGDTLLVKNEDTQSHQLGPLWVPAGSSASLQLSRVDRYSYACSFQPTQYLGIVVQPRTTLSVRLTGIILAGLPTGIMLAVYSLVLFPAQNLSRRWPMPN